MREQPFTQVCVWPGTLMGVATPLQFEVFIKEELGARVEFLEVIMTNPDLDDDGNPVPETGDRSDIFFAVHSEDLAGFAVPRLAYGIRWFEDVVGTHNSNGTLSLYPSRVMDYWTWDDELKPRAA